MAQERTLGQLVADATSDLSEIVRAEVQLAKTELAVTAKHGALASGMFGAAGYLAFLASIMVTISVAYGLAGLGVPRWLAFALVATGLLVTAGILALLGRSQVSRVAAPERTLRSVKDTLAAVKPGGPRER